MLVLQALGLNSFLKEKYLLLNNYLQHIIFSSL